MKVLCIHLKRREDRHKSFTEGVGKDCPFEYLDAIDKNENHFVSDYFECRGDLCCRASHALAWMKCIAMQENFLIFEDDVLTDQTVDWKALENLVDNFKGNEVLFFTERCNTHAYVVTPVSAEVLLEEHIRCVNPVNMVQMSVDHRIQYRRWRNHFSVHILEGYRFYQHGDRERSDNEWTWPEKLGKNISYPPFK
jgi:GR25 family glycosyltransferase involved in LPS biosynthesis